MEAGRTPAISRFPEILSSMCPRFRPGGLALAMIARPGSTEDIDVLVLLNEEQREKLSVII